MLAGSLVSLNGGLTTMNENDTPAKVEGWWQSHTTGRAISMVLALAGGIGIFWLLFMRAKWNPPVGDAEFFWLRVFIAFGINAGVQEWTLATETGRGGEFYASLDKFVALTPAFVFVICEVYWIGAESILALTWRHHVVGVVWAVYAVIDYFSTDITNQRLRALQFAPARQS